MGNLHIPGEVGKMIDSKLPFESFDPEKPKSQETIPVKSQAIPWVGCDCRGWGC